MGLEYQNGAQRDPVTLADVFKPRARRGRAGWYFLTRVLQVKTRRLLSSGYGSGLNEYRITCIQEQSVRGVASCVCGDLIFANTSDHIQFWLQ